MNSTQHVNMNEMTIFMYVKNLFQGCVWSHAYRIPSQLTISLHHNCHFRPPLCYFEANKKLNIFLNLTRWIRKQEFVTLKKLDISLEPNLGQWWTYEVTTGMFKICQKKSISYLIFDFNTIKTILFQWIQKLDFLIFLTYYSQCMAHVPWHVQLY